MENEPVRDETRPEQEIEDDVQNEDELRMQAEQEGEFDGPPLLPENSNDAAVQRYKRSIVQYSKECYCLAKDAKLEGERLWYEFCYVFRPRLFEYLDRTQLFCWVTLLQENGVHLSYSRGQRRTTVLTECFRRSRFIPSQEFLQQRNQAQLFNGASPHTQNQVPHDNSNNIHPVPVLNDSAMRNLAYNAPSAQRNVENSNPTP